MKEVVRKLHHVVILKGYPLPLLFILNLILGGMTSLDVCAAQSSVDLSCCECHNETCVVGLGKDYVHQPFREQKCPVCHVYDDAEKQEVTDVIIVNVPNHLPMRRNDELFIAVCTKCHAGFTADGNHPVRAHPSIKVTIPADLLTAADGGIVCVTCHANHASDFEFRTIKSSYRALCVGCHKGYPSPTGTPAFTLIR